MFCRNCQKEVGDAKFCPNCGSPTTDIVETVSPPKKWYQRLGTVLLLVLGFIWTLGGIGGIIQAYQSQDAGAWVAILIFYLLPFGIYFFITRAKKKKACKRCKKSGPFHYILPSGYCPKCDRLNQIEGKSQIIMAEKSATRIQLQEDMLQNEVMKTDKLLQKKNKELQTLTNRLQKMLDIYARVEYAVKQYTATDGKDLSAFKKGKGNLLQEGLAVLEPVMEMRFQCMENRILRKRFNENKKQVDDIIERYGKRYATATNVAIHNLTALGLKAELQNILSNVRYDKLEISLNEVRQLTTHYLALATEGNKTILPIMKNFISEIEFIFLQMVNIEHEYYVHKEQIKEEQRTLREQMRQEAEERRLLAQQQKQMEKEEEKYKNEIKAVQTQMEVEKANEEKYQQLLNRLNALQEQLAATENKKDDIIKLQNGQAGYVYVISNLGVFGDNVFKIGMTRRLEPMERVHELSNASLPFPYDVHCFIFSQNAVELENNIHHALHNKRVNKVNLRKEFFKLSIDDMEQLVHNLEPSAEFNRTMLAEQYHQSLSIQDIPEEFPLLLDIDEEEAS